MLGKTLPAFQLDSGALAASGKTAPHRGGAVLSHLPVFDMRARKRQNTRIAWTFLTGFAPMPNSKHRRKGKLRPRGKVNTSIRPEPVIDPQYHWRQDAVLVAQLQKMYGGDGRRDWTDEQIDAAIDELDREGTATFLRWAAKLRADPPPPQQLELFPVNSLDG